MTNETKPTEKIDLQTLQMGQLERATLAVGSNLLRGEQNPFGQVGTMAGKQSYNSFMQGEEAEKYRKEMYNQEVEKAQKLGLADMPEYPTNYELTKNFVISAKDAQSILKLGNLELIVNKLGKLDFKIPEKLKAISYRDIIKKVQEANGDESVLTDSDKDVLKYHQLLTQAYELNASNILIQNSYLTGINSAGKELGKKYKPTPENPSQ